MRFNSSSPSICEQENVSASLEVTTAVLSEEELAANDASGPVCARERTHLGHVDVRQDQCDALLVAAT